MRQSEDALAERELGQFPVSIGTSLALEGAGGIYPDETPVTPPPLVNYNQLWVNVATLFRNLFNSLSAADQERVTVEDLTIALASEFSPIDAAVAELVGRKVQVVFYRNALSRMARWFPKANHKIPTTPKQRIYAGLMEQTLEALPTYLEEVDYRGFDGPLDGSGRTLILTHSAVDLLSSARFDSLTLLESHTGKLKERSQWGTKLGVKDATMPFNAFTLQVFGDGATHFSPMSIKHRRAIQEIAKRDRWTAVTTMAKIRVGVHAIKDPDVRETLTTLLDSTSFPT
jgi:hypothetical protein